MSGRAQGLRNLFSGHARLPVPPLLRLLALQQEWWLAERV
jgi:hypothetical protein